MAWFYMNAMGNSTERILASDNVWDFDKEMLYDATVTLAIYTWANELYEKVYKTKTCPFTA